MYTLYQLSEYNVKDKVRFIPNSLWLMANSLWFNYMLYAIRYTLINYPPIKLDISRYGGGDLHGE